MAKLNDLTGKTFGNWKVLYRNGSTKNKASVWRCQCLLCGSEYDVVGQTLTNGTSTKCRACVPRTTLRGKYYGDKIRNIYSGMMQRCYNESQTRYPRYGGRGIIVCDEWKGHFETFADWAYSNGYSQGMSIERIDSNGNYCPNNCRFIHKSEQAKNRSITQWVTINNEKLCLTDMCKKYNIHRKTVTSYANRNNVSIQEAFEHFI